MKYRPLPVIEEINKLGETEPVRALEYQNALMRELVHSKGFQLLLTVLQNLELQTLNALRAGGLGRTDFMLGRLGAVEQIRRDILALFPDENIPSMEGEEEFEAAAVYESPFAIPYPNLENAEPK